MTTRTFSRIAALAIAIAIAACGQDADSPPVFAATWFDLPAELMQGTAIITVRNGATPISGVHLHYSRRYPDGALSGVTDANGRHTIKVPEEAAQTWDLFTLWLTLPAATFVNAPLGQDGVQFDSVFHLKVGANTTITSGATGHAEYRFDIDLAVYGNVSGKVVLDDPGKTPVPDLPVMMKPHGATSSEERVVSTAADGSYSFPKTKPGALDLSLGRAVRSYRHINRAQLEAITLGQGQTLNTEIIVAPIGEVSGYVHAAGVPDVPGATIRIDGEEVTSTSDGVGHYLLSALVGSRTVTITPPAGYSIAAGTSGQVVVNVSRGSTTFWDWYLVRTVDAGTISGRVVTETGAGVADATVTLNDGTSTIPVKTSATGAYTFQGLTPRAVSLTLVAPAGYELAPNQSATRQVTVVGGQTVTVPDWLLRPSAGSIVARVRNSGEAYAGATVGLTAGNRIGVTGADGTATFAGVAAGAHQLTLTVPPEFALDLGETALKTTTVAAGQTAAVAWNIVNVGHGAANILGTVSAAGVGGVGGVVLTLSNTTTVTTAANGTYAFPDVPAGVYEMTIAVPATYTLAGGSAKVRVVVRPAAGVSKVDWILIRA